MKSLTIMKREQDSKNETSYTLRSLKLRDTKFCAILNTYIFVWNVTLIIDCIDIRFNIAIQRYKYSINQCIPPKYL